MSKFSKAQLEFIITFCDDSMYRIAQIHHRSHDAVMQQQLRIETLMHLKADAYNEWCKMVDDDFDRQIGLK